MNNAKKLLYNTLLLTAAAFVMRTVLVGFNVFLSNRIGAEGIGLFQLISSVYGMAVTFSSGGIRLASMRLTADNLALGRSNQRRIMTLALSYASVCGCAVGILLFLFSQTISVKWIDNTDAIKSLKLLSISLPFVSSSAALNGYFTAESKILRYTVVQLLEQGVKITVTVVCLSIFGKNTESSCAAVITGICVGEVFSLLCSYALYRFASSEENEKNTKGIFKGLMRIAVPDALGSEIRSVLTTAEHMLIPRGLKKSGSSSDAAITTYGIIHGMSLPVILYPSALLSSLSGLLVPEISAHHIAGSEKRIEYIIRRVLRITLLFSIGTAGIMYFCADMLSEAFYPGKDAGYYIRILSPLVPVMYCDTSVDGILKGLDQQIQYMKYNIIDAFSCVVLVYFLVPAMSVKGYIFTVFFSEILNFTLSFHRLTVVANVRMDIYKDILVPVFTIILSCMSVKLISNTFYIGISPKIALLFTVTICAAVYIILLRLFRAIDKEEINWIKGLLVKK